MYYWYLLNLVLLKQSLSNNQTIPLILTVQRKDASSDESTYSRNWIIAESVYFFFKFQIMNGFRESMGEASEGSYAVVDIDIALDERGKSKLGA